MTDYESGSGTMISGRGEVLSKCFRKIVGKTHVWYIAVQPNSGDNIYCTKPGKGPSEGFGGATLEFLLESGEIDPVQGPWHSNADALLSDTEIDLRDKYATRVVLGTGPWEYQKGLHWKMHDVFYQESNFEIGTFGRGEELAQREANRLNQRVYYWIESKGGAIRSVKDPEKEVRNESILGV